jgi:hypothetical protein
MRASRVNFLLLVLFSLLPRSSEKNEEGPSSPSFFFGERGARYVTFAVLAFLTARACKRARAACSRYMRLVLVLVHRGVISS